MSGDDALADAAMSDYQQADLTAAERALMRYAVAVTESPAQMSRSDVEQLRTHGYSDRAILDATHIVGYFNHINRLADALGVELEPEMR